jgi:hypothetical protein
MTLRPTARRVQDQKRQEARGLLCEAGLITQGSSPDPLKSTKTFRGPRNFSPRDLGLSGSYRPRCEEGFGHQASAILRALEEAPYSIEPKDLLTRIQSMDKNALRAIKVRTSIRHIDTSFDLTHMILLVLTVD